MSANAPIHENFDQLVAAVAKETKLDPAKVKEVLSASFPSTRAWVLSEVGRHAPGVDAKALITKISV